jgi:hypothetical protein
MAEMRDEREGPGFDAVHDEAYRAHYAESGFADRSYEQLRPAYEMGHLAGGNRDNFGRDFESIEPDLQRGWLDELRATHGDWETVRRFARHAYERVRGASPASPGATFGTIARDATTPIDGLERPSFSDPIPPGDPDHVAGAGMPIPGRE